MHLHNLHKQGEGRTVQRGVLGGVGGELWGAHVQLRLAMWRDKYTSVRRALATAGFDDYMLRRPYDTLIDSKKRPHPSFAFMKPSGI